jgi:hypothetical protein
MKTTQTAPTHCYRIKMSREVAAYTKGKDVVALKMPLIFPSGTKLFMVEWAGGQLGRADVCTVIGTDNGKLVLARNYCWASHKLDDDLSHLSLLVEDENFSMVTKAAIPQETT